MFDSIPSYGSNAFDPSTYQLANTWAVSTLWLLWMGHMVALFTFEELTNFFKVDAQVYLTES